MKKYLPLILLLIGCEHNPTVVGPTNRTELPTDMLSFPTVDSTNAVFVEEFTGQIAPNNPGYWVDLDSDKSPDFVIFIGDTLYWKKSSQSNSVPLLKIKGEIIGYNIVFLDGKNHLYYITKDRKAFIRKNLGNDNNCNPFFGDAEEQ